MSFYRMLVKHLPVFGCVWLLTYHLIMLTVSWGNWIGLSLVVKSSRFRPTMFPLQRDLMDRLWLLFYIQVSDPTCTPQPSTLSGIPVWFHSIQVFVSLASLPHPLSPTTLTSKQKCVVSLSTLRTRMSWESDPSRGWSSPRTKRSHLIGAVSAFLCDFAL